MKKEVLAATGLLFVLSAGAFGLIGTNHTQVLIKEDRFEPETLEIKKGTTVVFKNETSDYRWPASNIHPTHGIYPEFDPREPIKRGDSWQFRFNKVGSWKYHDHLVPSVKGVIVVTDGIQSTDSIDIFQNEDTLYSYVKRFGPKQTIIHLDKLSNQFGSCHDAAHKAGRFSYEIYKEDAFKKCGAECHSGCYHGATEAYFKENGTANLEQNLRTLCSSESNPFFSHQCLHGIGHGLMAWTNYELFDALKNCELLNSGQGSCFTGVFMENIVGGLTDKKSGHYTKYLNDDSHYPCNIVDYKYKWSCYFLQTSRMLQLFGTDFNKVAQACKQAPEAYKRTCFESMGRDVGGINRNNPQGAIGACSNAPFGDLRIACLIGAAQDAFWDPSGQDTALNFCQLLSDSKEGDACYATIFGRAQDVLATKQEKVFFCSKAQNYQSQCLSQLQIL